MGSGEQVRHLRRNQRSSSEHHPGIKLATFAGAMYDATGSFVAPSLIAAGGLVLGGLLVVRSGARG